MEIQNFFSYIWSLQTSFHNWYLDYWVTVGVISSLLTIIVLGVHSVLSTTSKISSQMRASEYETERVGMMLIGLTLSWIHHFVLIASVWIVPMVGSYFLGTYLATKYKKRQEKKTLPGARVV